MQKFYDYYISKGYEKCRCRICVDMLYPVLVQEQNDSPSMEEDHKKYKESLNAQQDQQQINEANGSSG
jgi:hypothetical protein